MTTRLSKFALLTGSATESTLPEEFSWVENDDGTWTFANGTLQGRGHFVICAYSGAHGTASPSDHGLQVGDTLGTQGGRCWRVKSARVQGQFDCWGIAMGWYEDSDGTFIQIDGVIKGIGSNWKPGGRVYLPHYGYGAPNQGRKGALSFPIGIALNSTDLLLIPRLDV